MTTVLFIVRTLCILNTLSVQNSRYSCTKAYGRRRPDGKLLLENHESYTHKGLFCNRHCERFSAKQSPKNQQIDSAKNASQ
jgi:hypothetical protein